MTQGPPAAVSSVSSQKYASLPTWDPPTRTPPQQAPTFPFIQQRLTSSLTSSVSQLRPPPRASCCRLTSVLADVRVWTDTVEAEGLLPQVRHPRRRLAEALGPPLRAEARYKLGDEGRRERQPPSVPRYHRTGKSIANALSEAASPASPLQQPLMSCAAQLGGPHPPVAPSPKAPSPHHCASCSCTAHLGSSPPT